MKTVPDRDSFLKNFIESGLIDRVVPILYECYVHGFFDGRENRDMELEEGEDGE